MSIGSISSSTAASRWEELLGTAKKQQKDDLASKLFGDLDADGSGGISLAESGLNQKTYDALDTNQDGVVTQDELQAALELQRSALFTRMRMEGDAPSGESDATGKSEAQKLLSSIMNGEPLGPPPPGGPGGPKDFASKLFNDLDADGSGGVSLTESGLSQSTFDSMDLNQDGVVSADEMNTALEKQRQLLGNGAGASGNDSGGGMQRLLTSLANKAYQLNSAYGQTNADIGASA